MKLKNRINFSASLLVFLLIIGIISPLFSQQRCFSGVLATPDIFDTYVKKSLLDSIYEDLKNIPLESSSQKCWIVFSDRDENELVNAQKKGKKKFLNFMERCKVKEINGNNLLVKSIDDKSKEGWIHASKLILSDVAAVLNEKSSTKKAMILTTVSDLDVSKMEEYQKQLSQMQFYNSPKVNFKFNGEVAKKFEIFYILKETNNKFLLSRSDKLIGSTIELSSVVKGWFPKVNITEWDHKVCWELRYGKEIKEDYKNTPVVIFSPGNRQSDGAKYLREYLKLEDKSKFKKYIISKFSVPEKRTNTLRMRLPILEHDSLDIGIKKTAVIASIENQKQETKENTIEKVQMLKKKVENVNILFVVDATQSMSRYFSSISESILDIIKNKEELGTTAQLRFGLAIYRDYPDSLNKKDFEIHSLEGVSKVQNLINFINTVHCQSNDSDILEAQYQGIVKGIRQAGFKEQESNVLVLIGDAGNHENDRRFCKADVVKELKKYEISLIAFQVISNSSIEYMKFNFDVQDFLTESAKKYLEQGEKASLSYIEDKQGIENTFKLVYNQNNDDDKFRMFGRFTYANPGKMMNTDILKQNIIQATSNYLNKTQFKLANLESAISGNNNAFTPEFKNFLERMGFTREQILILTNIGDVSSSGYTCNRFLGDDKADCFFPVVFLSHTEKEQMSNVFAKLSYPFTPSQRKRKFAESLLKTTQEMLGTTEEVAKDLTMDQVWDIILGVPFNGMLELKNRKIRDFDDIDDLKFEKFYSTFKKSADAFRNNSFQSSAFQIANQTFYWIPLNQIPGNE